MLLGLFSSKIGCREYVSIRRCVSFWNGNAVRILDLFDFLNFLELMNEVEVLVWGRWPEV